MAWRPMGSILQADRKESSTNAWAFLRVAAWAAEHNATRAGVLGGIMRRHLKVRGRLALCQGFKVFAVGEFGAFLELFFLRVFQPCHLGFCVEQNFTRIAKLVGMACSALAVDGSKNLAVLRV